MPTTLRHFDINADDVQRGSGGDDERQGDRSVVEGSAAGEGGSVKIGLRTEEWELRGSCGGAV